MIENQALVSFLAKQAKRVPADKRNALATVIESIKLCPLVLNLEDSLDLIGVDDFVTEQLNQFFRNCDKYVPKEGSIAQKMMRALHESHPESMTKADVLKAIGFRPPPATTFRGRPKFFGSWASMKTLESHGLVNRTTGRVASFSLTEQGLRLANEIFGMKGSDPAPTSPVTMVVAERDLNCRVTVDVRDVVRRTHIEWKAHQLPVGSVWFCKGNDVYDFMVQFASFSDVSDELFMRKVAGSPFSKVTLLVGEREREKHAEAKIKVAFDYGFSVVFAESAADMASYLTQLCKCLHERAKVLGKLDELATCAVSRVGQTIGDVWLEQLKIVPGLGPHMSANLSAVYPTPHALMRALSCSGNPADQFISDVANRCGRRPRQATVDPIVRLFSRTLQ